MPVLQNCFGLALPPFAMSPPPRLASRGSNSETVLQTLVLGTSSQSSAPIPLGSPFSHQPPWTAPGQCIALVNLPRPLPLRGYRRAAMPSDFATHFPLLPCASGRSALLCLTGASLRYDGTGRLTCRMVPCVAPSLASFHLLWDLTTSGHSSDPLLPRDLFYMSSNSRRRASSRPRAYPRCRCKSEARRPLAWQDGSREMETGRNRLLTMPRAPRILVHGSLMPRKEQSLSLLLCPQAVGHIPPCLVVVGDGICHGGRPRTTDCEVLATGSPAQTAAPSAGQAAILLGLGSRALIAPVLF